MNAAAVGVCPDVKLSALARQSTNTPVMDGELGVESVPLANVTDCVRDDSSPPRDG